MKRDAEKSMLTWYGGRHRKPLVLRGARQVGKSTLVRQFAASNGLSLQEINLERHRSLRRSFASMDLRRIADDLEVILERRLGEPGSLLFLDEIQECGEARTALKFLSQDGSCDGVASGSLLGKKVGETVVLAPPMLTMLPTMFTWPQLITALTGGVIALLIVPVLRKALHK